MWSNPRSRRNTPFAWERKNSYVKCRGNRIIEREKLFSPFSHLFHTNFENMFYMRSPGQYKRECFDFPSPFLQVESMSLHRLFIVDPLGSDITLGLLEEPWWLGQTSISVEMMMLESNFQSFLNFFFIGSLNGLLYSFAVGPSIRHLFC